MRELGHVVVVRVGRRHGPRHSAHTRCHSRRTTGVLPLSVVPQWRDAGLKALLLVRLLDRAEYICDRERRSVLGTEGHSISTQQHCDMEMSRRRSTHVGWCMCVAGDVHTGAGLSMAGL